MSQSRRRRRQLEKSFGLRKASSSFFSSEASVLRERRRKAGAEIHRQNLEKMRSIQRISFSDESLDPVEENPDDYPVDLFLNRTPSEESGPSGSDVAL